MEGFSLKFHTCHLSFASLATLLQKIVERVTWKKSKRATWLLRVSRSLEEGRIFTYSRVKLDLNRKRLTYEMTICLTGNKVKRAENTPIDANWIMCLLLVFFVNNSFSSKKTKRFVSQQSRSCFYCLWVFTKPICPNMSRLREPICIQKEVLTGQRVWERPVFK